jgi:hypothetical protein
MTIDRKQVFIFLAFVGLLWLLVSLWYPRDGYFRLLSNFDQPESFLLTTFLLFFEFITFCDPHPILYFFLADLQFSQKSRQHLNITLLIGNK